MRSFALVLLIVAARAVESKELVGSVELYDNDGNRIVGALNLIEEDLVPFGLTYFGNMWGLSGGTYIAVVHRCVFHEDICESIGLAREKLHRTGKLTEGREPLSLFRQKWSNSTNNVVLGASVDVSLVAGTDNDIADSIIAIYQDTLSGLKLCSQSQTKTAKPVAWGFVEPKLLKSDENKVPVRITDSEDDDNGTD